MSYRRMCPKWQKDIYSEVRDEIKKDIHKVQDEIQKDIIDFVQVDIYKDIWGEEKDEI